MNGDVTQKTILCHTGPTVTPLTPRGTALGERHQDCELDSKPREGIQSISDIGASLHAWLPLLAPFPLVGGGLGAGLQCRKGRLRSLAVMLLVISCFQQLCPFIQGVTAGASGNEMLSGAHMFKALLASSWPSLTVLLGNLQVY